jgi:CRP-like cAMP-binding protein
VADRLLTPQAGKEQQMVAITMDDRVALLRGSELFAELSDERLGELAGRLQRRAFRRGEVVFHRGDPAGVLHLIRCGCVKIHLPAEDGGETVLELLGEGSCFGELALLDGGLRSATATAVEPLETLALLRDDLLAFAREHPDVALALLQSVVGRLRRTNEWLEDAYVFDLDQRLARRLQQMAAEKGRVTAEGIEVTFPLTQSELAGMLGVSRVAINRQLGVYQDAGILRLGRGSFTVINPTALQRRAGTVG